MQAQRHVLKGPRIDLRFAAMQQHQVAFAREVVAP